MVTSTRNSQKQIDQKASKLLRIFSCQRNPEPEPKHKNKNSFDCLNDKHPSGP